MENRGKKNRVLAFAILAAGLPIGVGHAAAPTVYGQFNLSVDNLDNGTHSGVNVSSNSSRFGIKGDIQIGGDVAAIYQVESEVNADTGNLSSSTGNPAGTAANNSTSVLASRNTFLGLKSADWGTVRLGRFDTPVKNLGRKVDLFPDQIGDARNLTRGANTGVAGGTQARFDERVDNSIGYTSPDFLGLVADLQFATNVDNGVAGTTTGAETNSNQNKLLDASVLYTRGPAFIGVGYEKVGFYSPTGADGNDPDIVRVAGSYNFGPARITALWQTVKGVSKTVSEDEDVYGLGVSFNVSDDWLLKAQGYKLSADADNKDATLLAFGTEYTLQKNVTLYLDYASVDNDDARGLVPYGQGRSDSLAGVVNGDSPNAISLGAIVKF